MSSAEADDSDELGFPQRFLAEVDELASRTDDGEAWSELMYGKWFVCPTAQIASTIEISLCRRNYYTADDDSDRLDVVADSPNLLDEANERGFEVPHVSLHDLIVQSIRTFCDPFSDADVLCDADKPNAEKFVRDIEATVASAIAELRLFIAKGTK